MGRIYMTDILIKLFIKNSQETNNPHIREKYGILSGIVGIFCNFMLFIGKFMAGLITSSISITADAFNNLSDAASSIVTLVGFKMAGKPADAQHPFGHGRIEYISGLIVSTVIIIMGFEFVKSSIEKIIEPETVEFGLVSIIILLASILVKLWMSIFNKKLGKSINSSTIKAISKDSLADVAATSTVLIGAIISYTTGVYVDGYAGILVALFIIYTGFTTAKETLSPLLGQAPDKDFVKKIEDKVLSYENIVGIHDLIVHNYGFGKVLVSLHAEVPCNINILKIHEIIDTIERDIKNELNCEIVIHMDPIATDDKTVNSTKEDIESIVKSIDTRLSIHDFRMVQAESFTNLIFDLVVPHKFELNDEELRKLVNEKIKELNPLYRVVLNIDKMFL